MHIDTPVTIADGAQTQHLGALTFAIIRDKVDDILTASDDELVEAMRFFAERMKLVVEPTGALAFAGALAYAESDPGGKLLHGERVGILISGGNVDLSRYARFLSAVTD